MRMPLQQRPVLVTLMNTPNATTNSSDTTAYGAKSRIVRVRALAPLALIVLLLCTRDMPDEQAALLASYSPVVVKWARIFSPSTFSLEQRCRELAWFAEKGKPFRGRALRSVGEDIETSFWESQFLSRAFSELTGIDVHHEVIGEGDVVRRLMEQTEEGASHYDVYVSDADLIGTHLRSGKIASLSEYMAGEGRSVTNPDLDLEDFLNLEFGQDYDGNQLQIPDYQFALVYWFRYDWFTDPAVMHEFRERFGYELGVPLNWAAYEDIAAFFTGRTMINPNDRQVVAYGHADYARPGPWLGWRFSDAFFSVAGMGDTGLPNGIPVDEWGIRVDDRIPVAASVSRGGAVNSPAAVYGLTKWIEYLKRWAPAESRRLDWLGYGALPARGDIAQTWYWTSIYAPLNPAYNKSGSPVCDKNGLPVWRIAPMPRGKYWREGMKIGYQDAGSWTIPQSTAGDTRQMAWLWAQFCLSKTAAVKKFQAGATPVRRSTLYSEYVTRTMRHYGGMIEFLRSPMIKKFTDTGPNVPHYQKMQQVWRKNMPKAIDETFAPRQALDTIASRLDAIIDSLQTARYSPRLNPKRSREYWLSRPGAPKEKMQNDPAPQTISYDKLLEQWTR